MLKQITCDKFTVQPEPFRAGLNVVLGSSGGSNAIGKSTFLLILDFVFGGDDYIKTAKDVFDKIGHHQINFVFEFEGEPLAHFYRKTNHPNNVMQTDGAYSTVIKERTAADYRQWLFEHYKIELKYLKFDEVVGRFFRIYGRGNHNEHRPLQVDRETMATAVDYLMKLLGKYEDVCNLKTAEEQYGIKPLKSAERNISDITADIGENLAKIEGLEGRREKIIQQNEEANLSALGLDHEKTKQLAEVRKRIDQLDTKKAGLESQLRIIKSNMPGKDGRVHKDFSALRQFFPNVDIQALTDVEIFHARINGFLSADIQEEIDLLQPQLDEVDEEIADLDAKIKESWVARDFSQRILNNYARVAREIADLTQKNKELKTEIEAIKRRQELEELLANLRKRQNEALAAAETEVNEEMMKINAIVTEGNRPAPVLAIKQDKSFDFGTPEDKSEGTAYKNLVIYDLSMLTLTPLPVLIHDSSIVMHIEDADFEQILDLYQESGKAGKQTFIAIDKADSYNSKTSDALEEAAILRLSVGHEIFGKSWSRNKTETETELKPDDEPVSETDEETDTDIEQNPDEE